jgi:glycosyltransferase involved in cell wall biosynthesis
MQSDRIIINTSNLQKGGALQVATTFIEGLRGFCNEYHIFLSPALSLIIDSKAYPDNFVFYNVQKTSPFSFINGSSKSLNDLERRISPDYVFSIFGPPYWKPKKTKHLMGFANGLYLYDDLPYIHNMSLIKKIPFYLKKQYHRFLLKNGADLYVVQTNDMKKRFSKFINTPLNNIFVVYGGYHPVFSKPVDDLNILPERTENEFRFITISSYYPHKNLNILNSVVRALSKTAPDLNVKFILTLPYNIFVDNFDINNKSFINVGPVGIEECPYLYNESDALFLPTLVESYTASYPESMKMKKPIITSDYSFSRSVCLNAALYFDPLSVDSIVSTICALVKNPELYENLVDNGTVVVDNIPTFISMTEDYLDILKT